MLPPLTGTPGQIEHAEAERAALLLTLRARLGVITATWPSALSVEFHSLYEGAVLRVDSARPFRALRGQVLAAVCALLEHGRVTLAGEALIELDPAEQARAADLRRLASGAAPARRRPPLSLIRARILARVAGTPGRAVLHYLADHAPAAILSALAAPRSL